MTLNTALKWCVMAFSVSAALPLLAADKSLPAMPTLGMVALDDGALSAIDGREGVAVDLELRVNADATGAPLASLGGCTGNNNPCRIAFKFFNRESGSTGNKGEWIVWKDYYGLTRINNLWIDAGQTPGTGSGKADARLASEGNRFMSSSQDGSATCLLDAAKTAATCHEAARNKPMLALKFDNGNMGGLEMLLHLGRVSTEYGPEGYNRDDRGTSLGLLIGDTGGGSTAAASGPARFKITGTVGLFGF